MMIQFTLEFGVMYRNTVLQPNSNFRNHMQDIHSKEVRKH